MSSEVKIYDWTPRDMKEFHGPARVGLYVLASDYADLEAENARLQSAFDELAERYGKLQTGEDSLLARVVTERDAARAQLAAIQGGMGEADKHRAQPEVAENTGSHAMAKNQLSRQEQAVARDVEGVAAPCEASPGNDIFAWATFDGEGSYDLRLFDGNESYRDDFRRNNPRHHPDWVFPLYRNSITAAMAAEVERHRAANRDMQQMHAADRYEIDRLRAELAEVKGREAVPVAWMDEDGCLHTTLESATFRRRPVAPLYTTPPASPDVEGLKNAARYEWLRDHYHRFEHYRKSTGTVANLDREIDEQIAALSTLRQSHP